MIVNVNRHVKVDDSQDVRGGATVTYYSKGLSEASALPYSPALEPKTEEGYAY